MPRTASKGRKSAKTPAKPSPKKAAASPAPAPAPAAPAAPKMAFEENDEVLAKWPGTSLYFRAKAQREDHIRIWLDFFWWSHIFYCGEILLKLFLKYPTWP